MQVLVDDNLEGRWRGSSLRPGRCKHRLDHSVLEFFVVGLPARSSPAVHTLRHVRAETGGSRCRVQEKRHRRQVRTRGSVVAAINVGRCGWTPAKRCRRVRRAATRSTGKRRARLRLFASDGATTSNCFGSMRSATPKASASTAGISKATLPRKSGQTVRPVTASAKASGCRESLQLALRPDRPPPASVRAGRAP